MLILFSLTLPYAYLPPIHRLAHPLIILPNPILHHTIFIHHFPIPISLPCPPLALEISPIRPHIPSLSLLLVLFILSHILPPIWPCIRALAVHLVVFETPSIDPTVDVVVSAVARDFSIWPLADVSGVVGPGVFAVTVFVVVRVSALVAAPVLPGLETVAVGLVVRPLTLIWTCFPKVLSESLHNTLLPLPLKSIPLGTDQHPTAMGQVGLPPANILRPILPLLLSLLVPFPVFIYTSPITTAVLKLNHISFLRTLFKVDYIFPALPNELILNLFNELKLWTQVKGVIVLLWCWGVIMIITWVHRVCDEL